MSEKSFFDKLFNKSDTGDDGASATVAAESKEKTLGFFDRILKSNSDGDVVVASSASTTAAEATVDTVHEPVKLALRGGRSLIDPVVAYGFPATPAASTIKWFRAPAGGQLEDIPNLGDTYVLNPADIGARICAQWSTDDGMSQSNFAQLGPIMFDADGASRQSRVVLALVPTFHLNIYYFSICFLFPGPSRCRMCTDTVSLEHCASDAATLSRRSSSPSRARASSNSSSTVDARTASDVTLGDTPAPRPDAASLPQPHFALAYPSAPPPPPPSSSSSLSVSPSTTSNAQTSSTVAADHSANVAINARLQAALQDLELQRSQFERTKTNLANLQYQYDALQSAHDSVHMEQAELRAHIEQLQRDCDTVRRDRDALQVQVQLLLESSKLGEQVDVARLELAAVRDDALAWQSKHSLASTGAHCNINDGKRELCRNILSLCIHVFSCVLPHNKIAPCSLVHQIQSWLHARTRCNGSRHNSSS